MFAYAQTGSRTDDKAAIFFFPVKDVCVRIQAGQPDVCSIKALR